MLAISQLLETVNLKVNVLKFSMICTDCQRNPIVLDISFCKESVSLIVKVLEWGLVKVILPL